MRTPQSELKLQGLPDDLSLSEWWVHPTSRFQPVLVVLVHTRSPPCTAVGGRRGRRYNSRSFARVPLLAETRRRDYRRSRASQSDPADQTWSSLDRYRQRACEGGSL